MFLKCTKLKVDFVLGFIFLNMSISHQFWRLLLHSVKFAFHQNFCHFISPPQNPTIVSNNCNFSRFYTSYEIFVFSAPLQCNFIALIHHSIQMTLLKCWVWQEWKNTVSLPSFIFHKYFSSGVLRTMELEHMHFLCS